jgi:hypothetical protein
MPSWGPDLVNKLISISISIGLNTTDTSLHQRILTIRTNTLIEISASAKYCKILVTVPNMKFAVYYSSLRTIRYVGFHILIDIC